MKYKQWSGNTNSVFKSMAASIHTDKERQEHDYYATDPIAVRYLLEMESFTGPIWECACGEGHLSKEIEKHGYSVVSTDLIDRGYGTVYDFMSMDNLETDMDMITNPPYGILNDWITKGLNILENGRKMALFLPIRYLEGKGRKALYINSPPKTVYISSSRIQCAMNGDFEGTSKLNAVAYGWFVWEKGFSGNTTLKWFN